MDTSVERVNAQSKEIIVCTDLSEDADRLLQYAKAMCLRRGANLYLVHVLEVADLGGRDDEGLSPHISEVQACTERLNALAKRLHVPGLNINPVLLTGNVLQQIRQFVETVSPELVIVGTAGKHGLDRWLLGSTAEAMVRSLNCPVVTLGPHARAYRNGPIIFPTDFNPSAPEDFDYALGLSQTLRVPLHCVHFLPAKILNANHSGVRTVIASAFEQLISTIGSEQRGIRVFIEPGTHLSRDIVEFAREKSASAIVLGVMRRSSLQTHVPNHETFKILATASCPVYTISHSR